MNKFVIILVLVASIFLLGCTENDLVLPYTNTQLLARSTCLSTSDINQYNLGVYDGNLVFVDGNTLCFVSPNDLNIDVNSGTVNHALLTNLGWSVAGHTGTVDAVAGFDGSGVATEYLVSDFNNALVIPTVDTNFETAGYTAAQILLDTNAQTACGDAEVLFGNGSCGEIGRAHV